MERERFEKERLERERVERESVQREKEERERRAREDQEGKKAKDALLASLAAKKDSFSSMSFRTLFSVCMLSYSLSQLSSLPSALCARRPSMTRLHSFCLGCLEAQEFTAKSKSSDLSCHLCRAPFTLPAIDGVGAYTCNAFVDSLVKSAKANQGDINRVVKCDLCEDEDATMLR